MENTKTIWRDRLTRLARTNLSIEEFAAREGVRPASLRWWRWRLGSDAKKVRALTPLARAAGAVPSFVEVAPASETPSSRYEVVLTNGRVVRVPAEFNNSELARVLAVAEGGR